MSSSPTDILSTEEVNRYNDLATNSIPEKVKALFELCIKHVQQDQCKKLHPHVAILETEAHEFIDKLDKAGYCKGVIAYLLYVLFMSQLAELLGMQEKAIGKK